MEVLLFRVRLNVSSLEGFLVYKTELNEFVGGLEWNYTFHIYPRILRSSHKFRTRSYPTRADISSYASAIRHGGSRVSILFGTLVVSRCLTVVMDQSNKQLVRPLYIV